MSSDAPGPRPRQVTIGGWLVAVASAVLVVTVFDTMAHLQSVDTRDALTKALTTGSGKGLGMSVDTALTVIRWALFVAGATAATSAVLGVFVLQRHTRARIALTVAAVPTVLAAPIGGWGRAGSDSGDALLLGLLIAAATVLLWTQPARDWFAGRPAQRRERPVPAVPRAAAPPLRPPSVEPVDVRRSWPPPSPVAAPAPKPGWGQFSPVGPGAPALTLAPRVPPGVRIACLLTWIFSALTAGLYIVIILAVAIDRDGMLDLLHDNGVDQRSFTDDQVIGVLVAMSALMILWCLVASVFAILTWRRQSWAWIVLLLSTAASAVFEVFAFPFSVLHMAASIGAFVLLLRPAVRAWIRRPAPEVQVRPVHDWPPPSGPPQPPAEPPRMPSGKPPVW